MSGELTVDQFGARFLEVGKRRRAWHFEGNLIDPEAGMDLLEGCISIRADVEFEVTELFAQIGDQMVPSGQFGVTRRAQMRDGLEITGAKVIATCKPGWQPVNPMWLCEQFNPAVKYFPLETMGSLRNDEIFYFTLKQEPFDVLTNGKSDPHDVFTYVIDYHVPNTAAIVGSGSTRIVCKNTMDRAIRAASFTLPIPHNGNIKLIASEIAQSLTRIGSTRAALRDAYNMMAATPIKMDDARELYRKAFPDMKKPRVVVTLDGLTPESSEIELAMASGTEIKAYKEQAENNWSTRNRQMEYLRDSAEISLLNMVEVEGLGLNVYTALQSVGEVAEHRADFKRGDVQLDRLDGGRAQQMARATEFAYAMIRN